MMKIENETVSFTLQYVSSEMAHFLVTGQNAPVADAALGLWSLGMTLLEVAMLEHPLRSSWGWPRSRCCVCPLLAEVPLEGLEHSYPGMGKMLRRWFVATTACEALLSTAFAHPWFG